MYEYRVDCWQIKKATVAVGDQVKVTGNQGIIVRTHIKAKRIEKIEIQRVDSKARRKKKVVPICACGEPDSPLEAKDFLAKEIVREGKVLSITEGPSGFWLSMESNKSPD